MGQIKDVLNNRVDKIYNRRVGKKAEKKTFYRVVFRWQIYALYICGRQIKEEMENHGIYAMNANGSEQKRSTRNRADESSHSWSPFLPSEDMAIEKK